MNIVLLPMWSGQERRKFYFLKNSAMNVVQCFILVIMLQMTDIAVPYGIFFGLRVMRRSIVTPQKTCISGNMDPKSRQICQYVKVRKVHPGTGNEGLNGKFGYNSNLSLISALEGVGGQHHTPAALARKRDRVHILQQVRWASGPVWTGEEDVAPTGFRSHDHPTPSGSLYRPRFPGPPKFVKMRGKVIFNTFLFYVIELWQKWVASQTTVTKVLLLALACF